MRFAVVGNYGATNIGDEAILASILKEHSGHEFTVFSANPAESEKRHGIKAAPLFPFGFRSFFKYGFRRSLKALKSADAVILGGGGLFQDDRLYACFLWGWQLFWVNFFRKPLFVYAVGVGPLKTNLGRALTRRALQHAQVITVRDPASKKLLQEIGLDEGEIHVTANPAWQFKSSPGLPEREKGLILISLRPWKRHELKMVEIFTEFLLKLKAEKHCRFEFISMQSIKEKDDGLLSRLVKRVGGEMIDPGSFEILLKKMGQAEFAIGMRMHFLIAALLTQTPALPLSYGPKVDAIFERTPLEAYQIGLADLSAERLLQTLRRLSADYNNVKIYEKKRAEFLKGDAQKTARLFHQWIKDLEDSVDEVALHH